MNHETKQNLAVVLGVVLIIAVGIPVLLVTAIAVADKLMDWYGL